MKTEELTEASYHGKPEMERLFDAIAGVFPFIGYESSGAEQREEELSVAFKEITGMEWYEWKQKRS